MDDKRLKYSRLKPTKADFILIIVFLLFVLLFYLVKNNYNHNDNLVEIYVNNELYGSYNLQDDYDVEIFHDNIHTNTLSIKGGIAKMTYSTCKNQLCKKQQGICLCNESICCLPNKVYVVIVSSVNKDYDAITK